MLPLLDAIGGPRSVSAALGVVLDVVREVP
jgi:hypothetical protein